jgi:hypothetical protein
MIYLLELGIVIKAKLAKANDAKRWVFQFG